MEPASAHAGAPAPNSFTDGLGARRRTTDPVRHEPIELLCLRGELTAVPSFEFALRERVSHLASFRRACFGGVRSVERLKSPPSALVLVSDVTAGVRLSDLLAFAERADVPLDIDAALCLLRQIVPAVAMLHEQTPDVAHGAIAPERIIVTPNARIVMVEHVLGAALSELQYTRERYWKELRVAIPGTTGPVAFNHRSDVTQLGAVALALIVGRPLTDDELPARLGEVVASSWAISARGGLEPLPAGLRAWLMRALQLDPRESFESAVVAHEDLENVLGDSDYMAAPASLEAFLTHYRAETGTGALDSASSADRAADAVRHAESPSTPRSLDAGLPSAAARVKPSEALRPADVRPAAPVAPAANAAPIVPAPAPAAAAPPAASSAMPPLGVHDSHPGPSSVKPDVSAASEKTPIYVPPAVEKTPIYVPPGVERAATSNASPAPERASTYGAANTEKTPIYVPPAVERTPTYIPPAVEKTSASVAPAAEKTATYVPPALDKTPIYVPPAVAKTPTYVPPAVEKTPAYAPPAIDKASTHVPPAGDNKAPTSIPPAVHKARSFGGTSDRTPSYASGSYASPVTSRLFDQRFDQKPFNAKPLEYRAPDYKPVDHKAADLKAAEHKPADPKAFEHKPADHKPAEPKPAQHAGVDLKPSLRPAPPPIDFSAPIDELAFAEDRGGAKKKWWMAAAAVAVLAVAGIAVPSVRKLVAPTPPTNEGT